MTAYFHATSLVTGEPQVSLLPSPMPCVSVGFGADPWAPDIHLRDAGQARALADAFTRAAELLEEAAAGEPAPDVAVGIDPLAIAPNCIGDVS